MKKLVFILFFTCLVIFLNVACARFIYVPYQPVYRQGDKLIVSEEPIPIELQKNILKVFEFHDVPYKVDKGVILIPQAVWKDREIVWNYTTKANDAEWLRTR